MGSSAVVAVSVPVHRTLHYSIPDRLAPFVRPGVRCVVPLGKTLVHAYVVALEDAPPPGEAKSIAEVLEPEPSLSPDLLQLGLWLGAYYHCPPGEALATLLPPAFRARCSPVYRVVAGTCGPSGGPEAALWAELCRKGEVSASSVAPADQPVLERLLKRGLALREWRVCDRPAPRPRESFRLTDAAPRPEELTRRAPQLAALLETLGAGPLVSSELHARGVPRSAVARAEAKGWVERRTLPRLPLPAANLGFGAGEAPLRLTSEQAAAVNAVGAALGSGFRSFLLQGVTGSGKTEVYLRVAAEARGRGLGCIVVVPEIALTPQLLGRFASRFGEDVAVLHSGLGGPERRLQWERARSGEAGIVVGARSAVLAPVANLGLLIVDEEHETSYKQEEALRYHAKHVALMRARSSAAVVVLGSATPDVETWWAARSGRHSLLTLGCRATGAAPPDVRIVDLRQEERRRRGGVLLSEPLIAAVGEALGRGEQALLFLNRRGFSPALFCPACGESIRCRACSVALTLHRSGAAPHLLCHYCGARTRPPPACPSCGQTNLVPSGVGTQRLLELARELWPTARIVRFDRDTAPAASRPGAEGGVLGAFARGEADILVGTQMVAKGHHFPGLTLVGAVDADLSLSFPDFRAAERTFQLLTQVAGRAGREGLPGVVYLQTRNPHHPVLVGVAEGDYDSFARAELEARREAGFPPFRRLALLRISAPAREQAEKAAAELASRATRLGRPLGVEALGPAPAAIERVRGRFRLQILLRAPGAEPGPVQAVIRRLFAPEAVRPGRDVRVHADVDPVSFL